MPRVFLEIEAEFLNNTGGIRTPARTD